MIGSKRLKAGDITHRVSVQSPVRTDVGAGEKAVTSWTTVVYRYASIEALSGRETWLGQQVQADATYGVKMRPVSGWSADWSLLWGSRRFQLATPPLDPVCDGEQVGMQVVEVPA